MRARFEREVLVHRLLARLSRLRFRRPLKKKRTALRPNDATLRKYILQGPPRPCKK
jgi:hypothetical protein